jgi:catechol 2,3-dioxygenase-like lactoylglutathione lyase family enzyme
MTSLLLAIGLVAAIHTPVLAPDHSLPFEPVTGAFFAVSVASMAPSVAWYRDKLGLDVTLEVQGPTQVTVLEGGGLTVELIRDPAARRPSASRPELVHGFFKAGFMVRDFDRAVEELRARGVTIAFGPFPATPQQRANVIIRDHAGNLIQIFGER